MLQPEQCSQTRNLLLQPRFNMQSQLDLFTLLSTLEFVLAKALNCTIHLTPASLLVTLIQKGVERWGLQPLRWLIQLDRWAILRETESAYRHILSCFCVTYTSSLLFPMEANHLHWQSCSTVWRTVVCWSWTESIQACVSVSRRRISRQPWRSCLFLLLKVKWQANFAR